MENERICRRTDNCQNATWRVFHAQIQAVFVVRGRFTLVPIRRRSNESGIHHVVSTLLKVHVAIVPLPSSTGMNYGFIALKYSCWQLLIYMCGVGSLHRTAPLGFTPSRSSCHGVSRVNHAFCNLNKSVYSVLPRRFACRSLPPVILVLKHTEHADHSLNVRPTLADTDQMVRRFMHINL